jgi:metallo-beta-lactamase family protein
MVRLGRSDRSIVFTGDLGNTPAPLLRDTEALPETNYLLMESVYGDRNHEHKDERSEKLRNAIIKTHKKGGVLLIPAFALQRTQVLLFEINNLVESGKIPELPVFLDSPLATKATDIYKRYTHLFNDAVQKQMADGDDIFAFPRFTIVRNREQSQKLDNIATPAIIIAGSGMSIGGRIRQHEQTFLEDSKNTLLFVGYQAYGTLGREIQDGKTSVDIDGKTVHVRADIESIRGFSAHKDSQNLLAFVGSGPVIPEKVFVCMGEVQSAEYLAQKLEDQYKTEAIVPREGKGVEIQL